MNEHKSVVHVLSKHIDAGVAKYKGELDSHLSQLITAAGLSYTPYRFTDGRILLVLPQNTGAFLYDCEETLFEKLNLSS